MNHSGDTNKMVGEDHIRDATKMVGETPRTTDRVVFIDGNPWVNAPFARGLERELNGANKRISWLESAVQDSIDACERDIGILEQRMNNLKTAKEAKP